MNRSWKKLLLKALNPLDYAARVLNNKTHLPPLHLRWDVGPLRNFESSAAEFRVYLKLLAGLKPTSSVLDIGCGCGQIAIELQRELDENGRYVGSDINKEAIAWCDAKIADSHKRYSFFHMDVRNGMYNPSGSHLGVEYHFPLKENFDIILLKSVFTHMLSEETENYLSQLPGLLSDNGKCLATFFLLNEEQRRLAQAGKNVIAFHQHDETIAFANPGVPEAVVAYDQSKLMQMLANHGLEVVEIRYGNWTGDKHHLSHQDIVVLQRKIHQ
jgi:cyclopropane fatty-acyl-phospholipid synthase-like methyltransferase